MQLGRLEIMDQAATDHISKISKVENLDKKHTVEPDEKYKNLAEQVNKVNTNEVILDNVKFGFDKETGDFFVRMENGSMDIQFPTEQIMKMKAYFKDAVDKLNKEG
jgi:ABC-type enterochelin transport system ATPase subunit